MLHRLVASDPMSTTLFDPAVVKQVRDQAATQSSTVLHVLSFSVPKRPSDAPPRRRPKRQRLMPIQDPQPGPSRPDTSVPIRGQQQQQQHQYQQHQQQQQSQNRQQAFKQKRSSGQRRRRDRPLKSSDKNVTANKSSHFEDKRVGGRLGQYHRAWSRDQWSHRVFRKGLGWKWAVPPPHFAFSTRHPPQSFWTSSNNC